MTYELNKDTIIEVRNGLQSVEKNWSKLAFEHIGAKNPDLKSVHEELTQNGVAKWEGFTLFHEAFER